jgi:hypothetical protein
MQTDTTEPEHPPAGRGHTLRALAERQAVVLETIDVLSSPSRLQRYQASARENVTRWRKARKRTIATTGQDPAPATVGRVMKGDWGVVTRALTEAYGETFAVLNMANAYHPGGGYLEGCTAQEENMFRRTDCHFSLGPPQVDPTTRMYTPEASALLNGEPGRVYLDVKHPRVCIRGPEDRGRQDLGYPWLEARDVFPFFELRAAAQDLRGGEGFDESEARRRIAAQLDTLVDAGVRHAVLGAHGCGAFENPAKAMARLYREELRERASAFECVAFAIHHAGYGPGNYEPFARVFEDPSSEA